MHQHIKIIVVAEDRETAISKAEETLNGLVEQKTIDYYNIEDGRWGITKKTCCYKANSKMGFQLLLDGIKANREEFDDSIKEVRKNLDVFNDDELFESVIDLNKNVKEKVIHKLSKNEYPKIDMFRYYCYCVGQYNENCIYVYNYDGDGIRNFNDLKRELNKHKGEYDDLNKKDIKDIKIDNDVWVVRADTHN